jgi:hypothetical protein
MAVEQDRFTVLFEHVGYRTLAVRAVQDDEGLLTASPGGAGR